MRNTRKFYMRITYRSPFSPLLSRLCFVAIALTCTIASAASADSVDILPKGSIDIKRFGLNAFANDPKYGTVKSQLQQACSTLGVRYLRVLFQWNDQVQASKSGSINFSFYDDIARNIPRGCQAVVVVAGLPSWMKRSENWINNNPRQTFSELWFRKLLNRYGTNSRITAWQVWNEPNDSNNPDNTTLDVIDPSQYLELGVFADQVRDEIAPRKLLVMAATTAVNQKFPQTLNYNKVLLELGAPSIFDIWSVHYYGVQLEHLLLGGIDSFLQSTGMRIWITESGEKGSSKQLNYVRRLWPFLRKRVPRVERIYYYSFTEDTGSTNSYALINKNLRQRYSDLYRYLQKLQESSR